LEKTGFESDYIKRYIYYVAVGNIENSKAAEIVEKTKEKFLSSGFTNANDKWHFVMTRTGESRIEMLP
jgi:hypothetical protein